MGSKAAGIVSRLIFRVRVKWSFASRVETICWRILGASIGKGTLLRKCQMTWPCQVSIGSDCLIESYVSFKFDGVWRDGRAIVIGSRSFIGTGVEFNVRDSVIIGDDALIASGVRFVDGCHGYRDARMKIGTQMDTARRIIVEDNVWIGVNAVVLQGIHIGSGAVVGAGAVVTKSIPPFEVWAGVPAKYVGKRT